MLSPFNCWNWRTRRPATQSTQLNGLLGGGTALTGGVSNELAGLCALLGGSQSHGVALNAMQVLQAQQAMVAQAATKQKDPEAEAVLQAKIDAEVEKRTQGLAMLPPPSPAKPKTKTAKTADVAPDDGVSLASGASKGAKRWKLKKHAERAEKVAELCDRLTVFEEGFEKVARAAATKKPSGYSSEDDTRPNKSPDSELRSVVNAVQRGLRKAHAMELKKKGDLVNNICALLTKDGGAGHYTPTQPRRSPRRASPQSAGSIYGHKRPIRFHEDGIIGTEERIQGALGLL